MADGRDTELLEEAERVREALVEVAQKLDDLGADLRAEVARRQHERRGRDARSA